MSDQKILPGNQAKLDLNAYKAPHLIDYGAVSELTETDAAGTGFDGGDTPSSYIS